MPYTGSKAQSGAQTIININTGTVSTPVWTLIGEVTDIGQSGKQNKTDDVTNLESTAEEFIPTLLSPGNFKIPVNRVQGDAGQIAVLASFNALPPTVVLYQIILPKTPSQSVSGDKYQFSAMVEEFNDLSTIKADKKITSSIGLKVSGPITFTAGS